MAFVIAASALEGAMVDRESEPFCGRGSGKNPTYVIKYPWPGTDLDSDAKWVSFLHRFTTLLTMFLSCLWWFGLTR